MKVWVLTYTVNDYNQHGEYFMGVFSKKPSVEKLRSVLESHGESRSDDYLNYLLGNDTKFKPMNHVDYIFLREMETND